MVACGTLGGTYGRTCRSSRNSASLCSINLSLAHLVSLAYILCACFNLDVECALWHAAALAFSMLVSDICALGSCIDLVSGMHRHTSAILRPLMLGRQYTSASSPAS